VASRTYAFACLCGARLDVTKSRVSAAIIAARGAGWTIAPRVMRCPDCPAPTEVPHA
jgi:hypothetical protein